ncbi:hypothetical protein F935_01592 [Acinetobacter calcoaceticus ANC 3811]|uniref:Acid shock protein n=1 Tax=Acinetobacter calcoaceticus ANC 3811 TaxID=1217690 RepID=R8Y927_ACICA|nr:MULTISPECIES: hypothetical protein [Acinetobacter]EOQ63962.1 hypothetical protein F935_01592 [Acinetobacter calcoaceticus ANC 3811]MBJ8497564.1 hypothetical protein [Acinetobacter oleivorans]
MKKLSTILTAGVLAMLSVSAFACPKGTQLQGGTGPNHKGGKCVAAHGKATAKKEAVKAKQDVKKDMTEQKHEAMMKSMHAQHDATQMKHDAMKPATKP